MVISTNLGFCRIGLKRELKKAQEAFWRGKIRESDLLQQAKTFRLRHWKLQQDAGIQHIPSNDFSLYDHVLDTIVMLGAIPERYHYSGPHLDLKTYFAMARGYQEEDQDVLAMEMTKWFNTNYHYIVPEFSKTTRFKLNASKVINEFMEAKKAGIHTRPVLLGPVSFLLLGKMHNESLGLWDLLLDQVLTVYGELLRQLDTAGADWVQIDEPCLMLDLDSRSQRAYQQAYKMLATASHLKILLATYFGALGDNLSVTVKLPVHGVHIDLVWKPQQLDSVLEQYPNDKILSLGLIDGRNIWKTDLQQALTIAQRAVSQLGSGRIMIAPSCSLLHAPVDLNAEKILDPELKKWLAFARQKLDEVRLLTNALNGQKDERTFVNNAAAIADRKTSLRIHNPAVKERMNTLSESMLRRQNPYKERIKRQHEELNLPLLPTTTIGSFPQTQEIRQMRAKLRKGEISQEAYDIFLEKETKALMKFQEKIGIDVPVHGEYERNDMVEYFGERLEGFAFTQNAWVQSYGSRCVKPPIIYGDVSRPEAMTVRWSRYAQSVIDKPVKGMLTGPVTMLQWSFVRNDQARELSCKQISLAIRDEVADLEKVGIKIIQIDEPALREGLPLRKKEWPSYLKWAVDGFRLASSGVKDATQIHTHMCYGEFNDILDSIAALDADVISIETSRSAMELLDAFSSFKYPNEIGPGVYDIHSPRVPSVDEMEALLQKALDVLTPEQIWVNPDCGLKTRGWEEVEHALQNMVQAARNLRQTLLAI